MNSSRRRFLTAAALASTAAPAFSSSAPRMIKAALIGCGGRGQTLIDAFAKLPDVGFKWLCEVDEARRNAAQRRLGNEVRATGDLRHVLEDEEVNTVIIATPDHWHAPAAILACEAGKHVYVEKPCSHTVREGRLLVEAARRNNSVVQHGTQVRSTDMMIEAVQLLRKGVIGDVLVCKAWNIQRRGSIGHQQPSDPPEGLDYDLWVGPARMIPYQKNRHQGWHWWYHFGTGDMGNDGVHDIDYARWGLGVTQHPRYISASGGKYFFDDDQEFPDTQQVTFEYPGSGKHGARRMLIYEQRLWSTSYPHNVDSGVEFYGTGGQMFLSRRGKIEVTGERRKRIEHGITPEAQNHEKHVANFVACIHSGERPNADIEIGHLTSSLCHLGNIATRLGRRLEFDGEREAMQRDPEADQLLTGQYRRHWATPEIPGPVF